MKKFIIGGMLMSLMSVTGLNAQNHEIKLDVGGLFVYNYGIAYEYIANENVSIVGGISYFQSPSAFDYEYNAFKITPEVRYFFNPDDDCDGMFVSGYLRYRSTNAEEYTFYYDDNNNYVPVEQKTSGLALGITTGRKWVGRKGFMFESYFGIGRYLIDNEKYSDGYDPDEFQSELDNLPAWDLRLGIVAGWRF